MKAPTCLSLYPHPLFAFILAGSEWEGCSAVTFLCQNGTICERPDPLLNPLDAVRIAALFSLEEIPLTVPDGNKLVLFWSIHFGKSALLLSLLWIASLLLWSNYTLDHKEV